MSNCVWAHAGLSCHAALSRSIALRVVIISDHSIGPGQVFAMGAERGYAPSAFEAGSWEGPLRISSNIFFLIALHMMSVRS